MGAFTVVGAGFRHHYAEASGDIVKAEMLSIDILTNMESIGNHSLYILQALRHRD